MRCEVTPSAGQTVTKAYLKELIANRQQKTNPFTNEQKTKTKLQPYRSLLKWALKHRIITLILAAVFFFGSLQLIPFIPKGLFDSGDTGLSTVVVSLPPGSPLEDTEQLLLQLSDTLEDNSAVKNVLAYAGSENVNSGTIYVNLLPKEVTRTQPTAVSRTNAGCLSNHSWG